MATQETTFNYHLWLAKQPLNIFRVLHSDNRTVLVLGHEALVDSPQPVLRIVRYHVKNLDVTKVTGGQKNRKEEVVTEEHVVATLSASFNAGAWAGVIEQSSELPLGEPGDPVQESVGEK